MKKKPNPDAVVPRRQAIIGGNVLAIVVPQGTSIFDISGKLLGHVADKKPVVNGQTIYLSDNDYNAARDALPKPKRIIQ